MSETKNKTAKTDTKIKPPERNYVVGIGASAGGLEALQGLLAALPATLDFSYVVIQHLSPDYKSLLSEILGKYTDMPVIQIEEGMAARPNCIYIIPPRKSISIARGILHLANQEDGVLHLPIDRFFTSLAEDAGNKAIGIVLSGTGSDGSNGIRNIKENDGVIIAQSPASCKFDGMPKSAIRTGLVDVQGTPEEIVAELEHIAQLAHNGNIQIGSEKEIDDALVTRIYFILKKVSGINFTHYKKATIFRRVERRMMLAHMESLSDYVDLLYAVPDEARILSKEVLIGVTSFFREPEYFNLLQEKAIRIILERSTGKEPIRVWVAGCSTGEEAYSIAMLFCETMEEMKIKREIKIFATDLDTEAIVTAGKGIYGSNIVASVSAARLSKYFSRKGSNYIINRDIRKMLIFAPHNVIQDPPFSKLDLISCRNLMIYFQPVLQKDLFSIFHAALKDEGFLFLGKSEAVGSYTEVFPVVDAAAKIFTHRSEVKMKGAKSIPYLQTMIEDYGSSDEISGDKRGDFSNQKPDTSDEQVAIKTAVLERFMPACIVVSDENELLYVYGDCKNFISFPVGKRSCALFDIIDESLRIPVSTALKEARDAEKMVQYTNIHFDSGEDIKGAINLTATPISKETSGSDSLYALVFDEVKSGTEIAEAVPYDVDHMAAQRITNLEQELSQVHTQLNDSIAEQETVNEELQASNEELLTANEELQSSNEELQSVNEELYTVNSEYQLKATQLSELNDDLTNFLATTLIGIIFVDSSLCIRRYTNYAKSEFNIMEQDIGRAIDFISYQFADLDIAEVCNNVISALVPDEREVDTVRGKTFLMRTAPFRTTENKILGCVITIVDITDQRREQMKLKKAEDQLTIAQKASEAKSDFLSRMSHEIRTPMNAIVGLTEMIETQFDDKEAMHKTARNMRETVDYMTSIVSDILEMSKIEHSQIELEAKTFALPDLLHQVTAMIEPKIKEKGLVLDSFVSKDLEQLYIGDATRIQQIILNLLSNAVKYTPQGGKVSFKATEKEREDDLVSIRFTISDTGIGIKPEFLKNIFKPFSREISGDNNASSSMGLGLSIAESLAKLMGGGIKVESEPGKGSTFTADIKLLAIGRGVENFENQSDETESVDLAGCNVLIAEDNAMNRTILEALLRRNGVAVTSTNDGEAVVSVFVAAAENTYDCILMDMRMPKLNGVEAALQIRKSNKADAKIVPIVAISANAFSEDLKAARQSGINDYLTKPIDTRKLLAILEKYWGVSEKRKTQIAKEAEAENKKK